MAVARTAAAVPRMRYPCAMIEIGGIRTFEDRAFQERMVRMSAAVLVAGAALGAAWFAAGMPDRLGLPPCELSGVLFGGAGPRIAGLPPVVWWLALLAAGSFASLVLHEAVHAVFFKAFAPPGARVTFGANWGAGMLYACAEGVVYTRGQYLAIALAPSLAVSAAAFALGMASGWPLLWYVVAVLHLTGCTGDWGYVRAIRSNRSIAYCEDTDWGVCFYAEGGAGAGAPAGTGEPAGAGAPACRDAGAGGDAPAGGRTGAGEPSKEAGRPDAAPEGRRP